MHNVFDSDALEPSRSILSLRTDSLSNEQYTTIEFVSPLAQDADELIETQSLSSRPNPDVGNCNVVGAHDVKLELFYVRAPF